MKNTLHWFGHNQVLQIGLQVAICLLIASMFAVTANATPSLQTGSVTPQAIYKLPMTTATPSIVSVHATPTASLSKASIAPRNVAGQPQVDANTVALYHFDVPSTVAVDATGNYTGTLYGNATISSTGLYSGVLNLDGNNSYVRVDHLASGNFVNQGSFELFVDFYPQCSHNNFAKFPILTLLDSNNQPIAMLRTEGYVIFEVLTPSGWQTAISGTNPCRYLYDGEIARQNFLASSGGPLPVWWPYETWRFHHIAATWGPRGVEIWLDGVLHGVGVDQVTPIAAQDNYNSMQDYWCNPQDQERSVYYPLCQTPVPGIVPLHGYGGGLRAYDSLLIGCDLGGLCFNTRIDELRISNIQRTLTTNVVPTVTPTPTQTPVPVNGEYVLDSHTRALYHFNSLPPDRLVSDATGTFGGYLSGNAKYVPNGRFGAGLAFDGQVSWDGYYSYANLNGYNSGPATIIDPAGTIETWFVLDSVNQAFAILDGTPIFLGMPWGSNTLMFGINDSVTMHWVDSRINPSSLIGCWHHIAGTWGPRGVEIWLDGVLQGTSSYLGSAVPNYTNYLAGCDANGHCMAGRIDETRISSTQRTFTFASVMAQRRASTPQARAPLPGSIETYLPLIDRGPTMPQPLCLQ